MNYSQEKLSEEKVFKDPVHRYIHVRDRVIWDLIGTKEFQRLRRIKQLGTTYLTFHGRSIAASIIRLASMKLLAELLMMVSREARME